MSTPEWTNSNGPQPPNPILSAYEGFVRDTPLVTRYVLTTLFMTWFLSFFIDPFFALSNIPYYSLLRFEVYRIILSPFLCSNLLSLVFAYLSFNTSGKRLEFSMGSTAFGWLLVTVGMATNIAFIALCFVLSALTNEEGWVHRSASGIWTILFGIISIECVSASQASLRQYQIFSVSIPTLYYPLVLWGIFSLLGGFSLGDLISVGIGYAYA
jgi:membrane associated rhomboid family serine protease